MVKRIAGIWVALLALRFAGHAATFTVTSTNLAGAGSLAQAILDANTNAGADTIAFNLSSGLRR